MSRKQRRIRLHLLVLLWIWGLLMFVVVDLFRDVEEFDRVRPQWRSYQLMRLAAHRMAGVPCSPDEFTGVVRATRPRRTAGAAALRTALAFVDRARGLDALARLAGNAPDPRARIRAMRRLADRFGAEARRPLLACVRDEGQGEKVRAQAARYLGRTGPAAQPVLAELAHGGPARIRRGARLGLAELGTGAAARSLLALEAGGELGRIANPDAVAVLAEVAADPDRSPRLRAASCRALGRTDSADALEPLITLLANRAAPAALRAAGAAALGRLGHRAALPAVERACGDAHRDVARAASLARERLRYATPETE